MGERRSRFYVSILLSTALTASNGCVRLDEGHCIVNGGDFACDEGRRCAAELTAVAELSDRGGGCVSIKGTEDYFDKYFVNVKYGLPDVLGRHNDSVEELDSVVGVLMHALEEDEADDVCRVDEALLEFEPSWHEVKAVRTFLERPSRVRVDDARLEPFQVEAIEEFNEEIDNWLEACGGLAMDG